MSQNKTPRPSLSRRRFLETVSRVPVALMMGSALGNSMISSASGAEVSPAGNRKKYPIGIELYAVREELKKDLPNTLRTVAKMGYEVVEFYSPYFGWTVPYAKEVRTLIDDLGLKCFSTHNHIASFTPGETLERAVELNKIIGSRHLIMASAPPWASGVAGWKRLCGQLTQAVEQLKPHGLTAGFHNHRTEWLPLDNGQRVMDLIAANTPPEFVLQFDVGTCVEAGADPIAWIKANPGRIKSVHLKDWAPGTAAEEKNYRVLFGEGVSPWKEIFAAAESVGGVEFYLMEQEGSRYSEFDTAQRCLDTWKKMRAQA
ncbi:MAG TPA: sugar phosphate isomerase/epimerase [Opitutaceae bacterium]|nr:sugar phosphate isomerase/epimerase [Opitutaceae bacterium]